MEYFKLRNNLITGNYNSMDKNDRTDVANAAFSDINKFFNRLGFNITMERLKEKKVQGIEVIEEN